MNIHQLSVNYLQEQDRILARINTTDGAELRLWFTRRLTMGLMPLLNKIVTEQVAKQEALKSPNISPTATADARTKALLTEFKKEESLQKSDFKTPFKDLPEQLPLGAEPLLVTQVNVTPLPGGQLQMAFSEKLPDTPNQRSFQIALEANLIHGFVHLLEKALATSLWTQGLALAGPAANERLPGESGGGDSEKPRYLN
jgi:hypothetical protein